MHRSHESSTFEKYEPRRQPACVAVTETDTLAKGDALLITENVKVAASEPVIVPNAVTVADAASEPVIVPVAGAVTDTLADADSLQITEPVKVDTPEPVKEISDVTVTDMLVDAEAMADSLSEAHALVEGEPVKVNTTEVVREPIGIEASAVIVAESVRVNVPEEVIEFVAVTVCFAVPEEVIEFVAVAVCFADCVADDVPDSLNEVTAVFEAELVRDDVPETVSKSVSVAEPDALDVGVDVVAADLVFEYISVVAGEGAGIATSPAFILTRTTDTAFIKSLYETSIGSRQGSALMAAATAGKPMVETLAAAAITSVESTAKVRFTLRTPNVMSLRRHAPRWRRARRAVAEEDVHGAVFTPSVAEKTTADVPMGR